MEEIESTSGDWREIMGKDIMIRTIIKGKGEIAEMGTVITCNLKGFLVKEDGQQADSPFETLRDQQFKIGESDAFPGLELTLRHSCVGETFALKCASRFAFGHTGRPAYTLSASTNGESSNSDSDKGAKISIPAVPADSDLYYEVEVLKHRREGETNEELDEVLALLLPGVSTTSEEYIEEYKRQAAMQEISLRKDCGNRWFSYLDFPRAARAYSKGTQIADNYFKSVPSATPEGEEAEKEAVNSKDLPVVHVYVACLNNLSACYLGQGENLKAKDMCVKVLEFDPSNVKALLRAAKASLALHDYLECDLCLKRVLEITPGHPTALSEMTKLRKAEKEYHARSKEMQKNMVKRLFPKDAANATAASASANASTTASGSAGEAAGENIAKKDESKVTGTVQSSESGGTERKPTSPKVPAAEEPSAPSSSGAATKDPSNKEDASAPAASAAATAASNGSATSTAAPAYISMYNASSNIVLLLATSLVVVLISIYVAYFAKYQQ